MKELIEKIKIADPILWILDKAMNVAFRKGGYSHKVNSV